MTDRNSNPGRPEPRSGPSFFSAETRQRAKKMDRLATLAIRFGGVSVVFCVIGILVLIFSEALPLFVDPRTEELSIYSDKSKNIQAVGVDDYLREIHFITKSGTLHYVDLKSQEIVETHQLGASENASLKSASVSGQGKWALHWQGGRTEQVSILSGVKFDETGQRVPLRGYKSEVIFPDNPKIELTDLRQVEDGFIRASYLNSQELQVDWITIQEDLFGELTEVKESGIFPIDTKPTTLALGPEGNVLACGTKEGQILIWKIVESGDMRREETVEVSSSSITALNWLKGGNSIVYGTQEGTIGTFFKVHDAGVVGGLRWAQGHSLPRRKGAIRSIVPSPRYRAIFCEDATGFVALDYVTNERRLLDFSNSGFESMNFSSRGTGFVTLNDQNQISTWQLDAPHPEVNREALFGKIWYENYPEPDYVWQSSGGTDDFEPKLSLMPLIFGTFKGALYAMLFAVPLGLCGALYTSQFASARFKNVVKPTLELLGAVPTVVIGFLAALWLAPRMEAHLISILTGFVVLPFTIFIGVFFWGYLRQLFSFHQHEKSNEWWLGLPGILIGFGLSVLLGPGIESAFFQGDFKLWLFETTGNPYDPRNSVIVSMALGFAVLPIIFTMSEDALSTVPTSLSAGSLALGASRWQTAYRVMLPSAFSGVLAALILGLGRAVGETMILLMATGNTAIIDLSPFNGMRTLSTNIAVEIPEAPVDGTLYRVLFLSAVVLFLFTSVLNTSAEWFRYRLNKKLGSEA